MNTAINICKFLFFENRIASSVYYFITGYTFADLLGFVDDVSIFSVIAPILAFVFWGMKVYDFYYDMKSNKADRELRNEILKLKREKHISYHCMLMSHLMVCEQLSTIKLNVHKNISSLRETDSTYL